VAISFNTGAKNTSSTASSVTLAIPAGVLANDVMVLFLEVFCEVSTAPTIGFSGGGGPWTLISMNTGTNPEVATAGSTIWSYGYAYVRVATAGDPGQTVTISETGSPAGTTWLAVVMGAYTGANTSTPIDVAFGNNAQGTSSGTAPSGNTATSGDWAIYGACVGLNGTPLTGPGTSRENIVSAALVGAAVDDSNGSVGGSGTTIGGGTWTQAGNTSNWWSLFTLGLKPPASAGPNGTVQPSSTLAHRRTAARGYWRGPAPVLVNAHGPAGQQPHGFASTRRPVGGLWAGSFTPQPNASGPSGTVPPHVIVARRTPARAVVRGTPPVTSAPATAVAGSVQPRATVPVPRRAPARALTQFILGSANAHGPSGSVQPRATVPVPRRATARALWQRILGPANAVPPPVSGTVQATGRTPPRRTAARGLWRGTPLAAVNAHGPAVPAPRCRPVVARRTAARGLWSGTPLATTTRAFADTLWEAGDARWQWQAGSGRQKWQQGDGRLQWTAAAGRLP